MSKQELMKLQTCVLRVHIHCHGCKKKVKQLLQKVEGVYSVAIDVEQGKVTVTGLADPNALLRKLDKSGKHCELWGPVKGMPNQNNMGFDNQMVKNVQQLGSGKSVNLENKSRNNSGNKGGNQHQQMQQLQQQPKLMKSIKDMKMGPKEQKAVKFNIPEEDSSDGSLHDLDDEFGDDDHDFNEEFGRGMKGNKEGKQKDQKKGSSGGKKKGGFFDNIPFLKKMGTKSKTKHGDGGGGGKSKGGGGHKDGGKNVWFPADFGKVSDFGEVMAKKKGGNGNGNGNNGAKQGEAKNNHGSQSHNKPKVSFNGNNLHQALNHPKGGGGGSRGSEGGFTGPTVPAMGSYPMGQMDGMPGMGGGGYYQNPYQQQYMGMMMNQHHQQPQQQHQGYGNEMYQPMMYARAPQAVGYVPPMPPPTSDPFVHMFNDENAESCSIM